MARFFGARHALRTRRRGRKAAKRSPVKVKLKIKGSPAQVRRAVKKIAEGGEDPNS